MAEIITRVLGNTPKNAPLSNEDIDNNFINLNLSTQNVDNLRGVTLVFTDLSEKDMITYNGVNWINTPETFSYSLVKTFAFMGA